MSEILARDPRTAWAWHEYQGSRDPLHVSDALAASLLRAIPEGDHVEVFARGIVHERHPIEMVMEPPLRDDARLLVRTLRRWITANPDETSVESFPSRGAGTCEVEMRKGTADFSWSAEFESCMVTVFPDRRESDEVRRIQKGSGADILRLPETEQIPNAPLLHSAAAQTASEHRLGHALVVDWRMAERIALHHMLLMGFTGSRLTGGVKDKGVDVTHPDAVAQVKMQGTPVTAPVIQQLRGTRPNAQNHLFYSTSGYTKAAESEAEHLGVALFTIDASGQTRPAGRAARQIEAGAAERQGGPMGAVAQYVDEVTDRVQAAVRNYVRGKSITMLMEQEPTRGVVRRCLGYIQKAEALVSDELYVGDAPIQSVMNQFRHADLLAGVFCRELELKYPGAEPLTPLTKSFDDFY